jgi:thioredoxin reductase
MGGRHGPAVMSGVGIGDAGAVAGGRRPRGAGEPEVFGGQAGTSSLIRNYPGFPHGISGDDLAFRTFEQAWLFGASFVFAQAATALAADAIAVQLAYEYLAEPAN